jgi:predicted patatin/cPLA2 family phospholipase
MVIRSRPYNYRKRNGIADYLLRTLFRRYPFLQDAMATRVFRYNEAVALIGKPPAGISIMEICPPDNFRVSRFSKSRSILQEGYEQGISIANGAIAQWNKI